MAYRYPPGSPLHHENLKAKQRELRGDFPEPLTLRVHRALSWLRRAEAEQTDEDVRFILLWIGVQCGLCRRRRSFARFKRR